MSSKLVIKYEPGFVPDVFLPMFTNYEFGERNVVNQLIRNQKNINKAEGNLALREPINKIFKNEIEELIKQDLLKNPKLIKYFVCPGSAGSGKSVAHAHIFVNRCLTTRNFTTLVIRENYSDFKESTWQTFMTVLTQLRLRKDIDYKLYTGKFEILFSNGSRIIFKGTDDPEDLKGLEGIDVIWLEEATAIPLDIWSELKTRLRGRYKVLDDGSIRRKYNQFYITFNPESEEHWLKDEFFLIDPNNRHKTLGGVRRDLIYITHSTFRDNHFLDQDEYFEQMSSLEKTDPTQFRVKAFGEWGRIGDSVYEGYVVESFNIRETSRQYTAQVYYGLDFATRKDHTALIGIIINNNKKTIHVFESRYLDNIRTSDLAELIKNDSCANFPIFADYADANRIKELRQYGATNVMDGFKGDKEKRIQKLKEYQIIIHPKCAPFIKEIDNYQWKRDRKTNRVVGLNNNGGDDLLDAMTYAATPIMKPNGGSLKIRNRDEFGI